MTIATEFLGARFTGGLHQDGKSFYGAWNPMSGRDGEGNIAYEAPGPGSSNSCFRPTTEPGPRSASCSGADPNRGISKPTLWL